ncbi:MAG: hypothetical protein HW394_1807 [Acidobacteria bacterium]|nr:hypothetical protein [Acidobacteriota bacterium]
MRRALFVSMTLIGLTVSLLADAQELGRRLGGANGPPAAEATPNRPAPKLADGTVDLSGVWTDGGGTEIVRLLKPGELDSLLLPWAKKLKDSRTDGQDPYNYCMPGGPLRITGGFAWRLVQHPTINATHIFMLQEGNAHTYRQIFMDGRTHPDDPSPTWYGHSTGRWDGDTLVIDTIGLNDKFWLDGSGTPHTEQLHLVERWTRTNFTTLRREVTIADPGAFTRPFTVTYTARLAEPGSEIMEYICIENNQYGLAQGITLPNAVK